MLHRRRSARAGVAKTLPSMTSPKASTHPGQPLRRSGSVLALPNIAKTSVAARPSLRRQRSADEDDPAVIDVGSGGSGSDEVAQGHEKAGRIVLSEKHRRIKTLPAGAMQGRRIDQGAGRIARG